MARTLMGSGTQASVIGTEHTLYDLTTNEGQVVDGLVDLGNMASGDTTEIRLYMKVRSAGTLRQIYYKSYSGAQSSPIIYVPSITQAKEWRLTLKQTAGVSRNYDWAVYA